MTLRHVLRFCGLGNASRETRLNATSTCSAKHTSTVRIGWRSTRWRCMCNLSLISCALLVSPVPASACGKNFLCIDLYLYIGYTCMVYIYIYIYKCIVRTFLTAIYRKLYKAVYMCLYVLVLHIYICIYIYTLFCYMYQSHTYSSLYHVKLYIYIYIYIYNLCVDIFNIIMHDIYIYIYSDRYW